MSVGSRSRSGGFTRGGEFSPWQDAAVRAVRRKSPLRLLVPVLLGLGLLAWALEAGRDRERSRGGEHPVAR